MKKPKPRPTKKDDPEQSRLFIKKAHEVGADEKHSKANDVLRQLARHKPEPRKKAGQR